MESDEKSLLAKSDREYLTAHAKFLEMPSRMRDWILHSPHASQDFARFFEKGGAIDPKDGVSLPYYHATEPPRIVVSKKDYDALRGPFAERAIESELAMFTTLPMKSATTSSTRARCHFVEAVKRAMSPIERSLRGVRSSMHFQSFQS